MSYQNVRDYFFQEGWPRDEEHLKPVWRNYSCLCVAKLHFVLCSYFCLLIITILN